MSKKLVFCLALLTIGVWVLSCVSPFYGTARIEPGGYLNVGGAAIRFVGITGLGGSALFPGPDMDLCYGVRGDFEFGHGFNDYLQINGRLGVGLGYSGEKVAALMDVGLGMQTALPLGAVTPALQVDLIPPRVAPILGIGRNEWLTLGGRIGPDPFLGADFFKEKQWDVFVTVHPWPRWSIFAGLSSSPFLSDVLDFPLIATLGVGYRAE